MYIYSYKSPTHVFKLSTEMHQVITWSIAYYSVNSNFKSA